MFSILAFSRLLIAGSRVVCHSRLRRFLFLISDRISGGRGCGVSFRLGAKLHLSRAVHIFEVKSEMADSIWVSHGVFAKGAHGLSFKVLENFVQFIFCVVVGGGRVAGELEITSRMGLWSDDSSFRLIAWMLYGILTKAMSRTSGLWPGCVG